MPFIITKCHHINGIMRASVKVDKAGRIVLPKPVRDRLELAARDELELESLEDRITLRPRRATTQLREKRGVWVFCCGAPLSAATVQQTIGQVRGERDARQLGKHRSGRFWTPRCSFRPSLKTMSITSEA